MTGWCQHHTPYGERCEDCEILARLKERRVKKIPCVATVPNPAAIVKAEPTTPNAKGKDE